MRNPLHTLVLALSGLTALLFQSPQAQAATATWTGGGADNYWSTGANWGGTPPASGTGNHLTFAGSNRPLSTNDISGLTNGWMQFSSGGFHLSGNDFTLNPSTGGVITNLAGTNTIALNLNIPAVSKVWQISAGSELCLAGGVVNAGAASPLVTLEGGGTLRITSSNFTSTRAMTLLRGSVIVDGGRVQHGNDGIRFVPTAGNTVTTRIVNNGTWRIGGGGNFRLGFSGSQAGGLSQMFLESGTLEFYGNSASGGNIYLGEVAGAKSVFTQNGGLVTVNSGGGNSLILGSAVNADAAYNLNGGTLRISQVRQGNAGATNAVFNFNGGTLIPFAGSTTFMQGLLAASIQDGGAMIDTTNLDVTIGQDLLAAGTGGLTKLGGGTLTLGGVCTYTGETVVSNGTLNVSGSLLGNGPVTVVAGILGGVGTLNGPVEIQPGATLAPGIAGIGQLVFADSLTLSGNLSIEINKTIGINDAMQVSGLLNNTGTGTLSVANLGGALAVGDRFTIFNQPLANGDALTLSPASPGSGLAWSNRLAVDGSIEVVPAPIISTPADLVALTLTPGVLQPGFNSNLTHYAASIPFSNHTATVTAVTAFPGATLQVICAGVTNGAVSGSPSPAIPLNVGTNLVTVHVTAADTTTTRDYTVALTRVPPNVLLVLVDDMGLSDWGCYGSEIPTPNLDQLAANGIRFRNFYNAARCSPTRCAILTGLYTHQVAVDPAQALPNLRNDNNVTIAEVLGVNGFRTYMSGKWHLGTATGYNPWQRGFQHYWGFPNGHSADNWLTNEYRLVSQNNEVTPRNYAAGTFYQPDSIGDYSVDFLNHHFSRNDGKPFFLHMTFGSAHFPLQAPRSYVNTHTLVYTQGWDVVRAARYDKMQTEGFIDGRYPLSARGGTAPHGSEPIEEIPAWNTLASDRQADLARRMAIYAAMVQKTDENIGRVIEALRQQGQLDNTLVIALSDNGGNHEGGRFGRTGSAINTTPLTGTALDNMGQDGQPIIHLGGGWANVNNTPYRLFKHSTHGGGIRTPMIVHWPQGLTRTNAWEEQPGHLIDIMATILDATGNSYPAQYSGRTVLPIEGTSLKPLFTSTNGVARTLGFEHENNRALIQGSWKFVTKNFTLFDGSSTSTELELYDLNTDPVELTNLANAYPAQMAAMVTNWNTWATRVGVPAARLLTYYTNAVPVIPVSPAPDASDLFLDTFDRPNQTDTDVVTNGISGSRFPQMGADNTYYEGYEGSGTASSIQVLNGALQMAVGVGMSENGLQHNFVGRDIVDAGGFSVEIQVQEINTDVSDALNRYAGFGVGLSATEAATGADIGSSPPAVGFRGSVGGNTGVADFFVELDLNSNIKVWRNGALLDTVDVGANQGTVTASFELAGFATTNTVTVKVFFNGRLVDIDTADTNSVSRTFQWDRNDSNHIGLSARASNFVQMDNLAIRKLPLTTGLATGYALQSGLTGAASAPDADPEGDGVSNFGEWAFGGDPASPDAFIASLKGVLVTPGNEFQFQYQRLQNPAQAGLQFRYFVSENLGDWTEMTPNLVHVSDNEDKAGYEILTLQLPPEVLAGNPRLFLRVLAEPVN